MSDWRQGGGDAKKPNAAPNPKKKPVPQLNPQPTGGWKGRDAKKRAAAAAPVGAGDSRTWTGSAALSEATSATSLVRWLLVGVLSTLAAALVVYLIYVLMQRPPRLPLIGFSVGKYSSRELLENSYGNQQRQALAGINESGIQFYTQESNGNDNGLGELGSPGWAETFVKVKSKKINGGGPERAFIAFYLSAFATFDEAGDLVIHSQNSRPFPTSEQADTNLLKLSTVLENLGSTANSGAIAWIILDLQLPPVVANLGDLAPPWRSATERALKDVSEPVRDRLLITLPGDDGQQNWLAPEYAASFLGHHLRETLAGRDSKITLVNNAVSLGDLRKHLDARVRTDAANRRHAVQQPVWLPEATFEKFRNKQVLTIPASPATNADSQELAKVELRFVAVDELWTRLASQEHQAAYRWDPLGYAAVESQLLMLEDVALYRPDEFAVAAKLMEDALLRLHLPKIEKKVSLIEDRLRYDYFSNNQVSPFKSAIDLAQSLAEQLAANPTLAADPAVGPLPSFWLPPPKDDQEIEARKSQPRPDEKLSTLQKPHFVWQLLVAIAAQNNNALRNEVFQRERLSQALAFAGDGQSGTASWLELYLIKRLITDIDWSKAVSTQAPNERANACADALLLFDRLQRLAVNPEPEMSWWFDDPQQQLSLGMQDAESKFLRGFDQCLAGAYSEAFNDFREATRQFDLLEPQVAALRSAFERYYRAMHDLPHLLAWQLREYQFAPELREVDARLQSLEQMVALTESLHSLLAKPLIVQAELNANSEALDQLHTKLLADFSVYVADKTSSKETGGAKTNAETFRRDRIALLNPFLQKDDRDRLHKNALVFLKKGEGATSSGEEPKLTERSSLPKLFEDRAWWKHLVAGELRREIVKSSFNEPLPLATSPKDLRAELWRMELLQRLVAPAFGSFSTLQLRISADTNGSTTSELNKWPWSAAWQRWNLAAANDAIFQSRRLATATWGDGDYSASSLAQDFYFHRLATKYELPPGFTNCEPITQLARQLDGERLAILDEAARRIKSLKAEFSEQSIALPTTPPMPVQVTGDSVPNAFAQVFLLSQKKRLPWNERQLFDDWLVDLSQDDTRTIKKEFETRYWQDSPPQGVLLFRGNRRAEPINWKIVETQQNQLQLTMRGQEPAEAKLRVASEEAPVVNLVLLVDCSNSMDTKVSVIEQKIPVLKNQFEIVKNSVELVIEQFAEMHATGELQVRATLIPFGLSYKQLPEQFKGILRSEGSDKDYYRPSRLEALDPNWQQTLRECLLALPIGDHTPLYNSVKDIADFSSADSQTLLYVFTDGVNSVGKGIGYRPASVTELTDAVKKKPNLSLKIYHFNNFNLWIGPAIKAQKVLYAKEVDEDGNLKWTSEALDAWEREQSPLQLMNFREGVAELERLRTVLEGQYRYFSSEDSDKVRDDAINSIVRTRVRVTSNDAQGQTFDSEPQFVRTPITVDPRFLPSTFEVQIERPFESADRKILFPIELYGGEDLVLPIDSRGRLKLPTFQTSGKISESEGRRVEKVPPSLRSRLFAQVFRGADSQKDRGLRLHFANDALTELTNRPRFLVAEASPSNAPDRVQRLVLADLRWAKRTTYPEVNFSDFPWPESNPKLQLRVWASDRVPPRITSTLLPPNESQPPIQLGVATLKLTTGQKLVAEVSYSQPPQPADRVVFICPTYLNAVRTYDQTNLTEVFEFELDEQQQTNGVEVRYATIGTLDDEVEAGNLSRFEFDQLSTDK